MSLDYVPGSKRQDALKLLIMGLDNAGKTSIILTLMRDFEKVEQVKPTTGIQRRVFDFLGVLIAEWDLGGQQVYRKTYLTSKAGEIFPNTKILIFIIDIHAKKRYDEAIEYLKGIVTQLNTLDIKPAIFVFFHKYDKEIENPLSGTELNNSSLALRNIIKEEIEYDNIEFYRTSIYNMQTLLIAMSKILLSVNSRSKAVESAIHELAERLGSDGLELIDDNSLIVGFYYKNKYIEELMNGVIPYFLQVNEIFERASLSLSYQDEDEPDDQMEIHRFGKYFLFKKFTLRKDESYFYILNCKKEPEFDEEQFEVFVNLIREILSAR